LRCNKDSFGLAAEALVKTIAARHNYGKQSGSWTDGTELISKYLVELGIDPNEFYIDDGSGLSRQNRLSANSVTAVLLNLYKKGYWQVYQDSLAVGGVDGTVSRYFRENEYRGKIIGKTGFISGVKSFSGICKSQQKDIIFSIISNNSNSKTREAINQIVKIIVDYDAN
jgi:D-alanyl-D-alanine carboxypeptidase/D-alanyl-D-alanine-endopeptidase (penicillin-binding protein 4)